MSKDKKKSEVVLTPEVMPEVVDMAPPSIAAPTAPLPKLADVDRLALDLAKEQRKTALAEAKTAIANNEKAELAFKYIVLQIYMKYGLTDQDAISEQGDIIKGGAAQQSK